jgi:hypothetical protein
VWRREEGHQISTSIGQLIEERCLAGNVSFKCGLASPFSEAWVLSEKCDMKMALVVILPVGLVIFLKQYVAKQWLALPELRQVVLISHFSGIHKSALMTSGKILCLD